MITKTEYLFNKPKEHYIGMPFPEIAYNRIADAKILHGQLYRQISYDPKKQDANQDVLRLRLSKVAKAIKTWERILDEDD